MEVVATWCDRMCRVCLRVSQPRWSCQRGGWMVRLQHCTGVSNIWINYSISTCNIQRRNHKYEQTLQQGVVQKWQLLCTEINDLCWPNCYWCRFSSSMSLLRILWSHHSICQNLRTSIDRNASSALYPQEVQVSAEARHWLGGGVGAGAKHLLDVIASSSIH